MCSRSMTMMFGMAISLAKGVMDFMKEITAGEDALR